MQSLCPLPVTLSQWGLALEWKELIEFGELPVRAGLALPFPSSTREEAIKENFREVAAVSCGIFVLSMLRKYFKDFQSGEGKGVVLCSSKTQGGCSTLQLS